MLIQNNISLKPYNSFGIDVLARHFIEINNYDELIEVLSAEKHEEKLVLGGGSNMLLTKNQEKLVIHLNLKGIEITAQDDDFVTVKVMAGENWHEFVVWCMKQDFGGI
mgnify:CR=1 FL=1